MLVTGKIKRLFNITREVLELTPVMMPVAHPVGAGWEKHYRCRAASQIPSSGSWCEPLSGSSRPRRRCSLKLPALLSALTAHVWLTMISFSTFTTTEPQEATVEAAVYVAPRRLELWQRCLEGRMGQSLLMQTKKCECYCKEQLLSSVAFM